MENLETVNLVIDEISKSYIGKKEIISDSVLAIFSGLHIIIEDVSGIGKTTLVKSISKVTGLKLGRIQFTPDLLPGDITGMTIWDNVKREFVLKKGPIFNQFIMGDEINRASPRTQSAFLEAMEEKSVTIDGTSFILPEPFIIVATRNPSYYIGTFDMPESQLDRFAIIINPGYPEKNNEIEILQNYKKSDNLSFIKQVTDSSSILKIREDILSINICDSVMGYIVDIGNKTRNNTDIKHGISTRGLKHLTTFSQCKAFLNNRNFVIPEDVLYSAKKVIPHKIKLSNEAIINNISPLDTISNLLKDIDIPVGIK